MEIRIRKHGIEFDSYHSVRPVRIILLDGQEFDIVELDDELEIRCINDTLSINPSCANMVSLKERKGE